MKKVALAFVAITVSGLLMLSLSGCCCPTEYFSDQFGKKIEKEIKKGVEEGTQDTGEDGVTKDVEGEDLDEVPRYPDSVRTFYAKTDAAGTLAYSIKYETSDEASKVTTWYKDEMGKKGWELSSSTSTGAGGETMVFSKNEFKENTTVTISSETGKTTIDIVYAKVS